MALWRKIDRDVADILGEGTLWCPRDGALYWTDILAPALNRMGLASGVIDRWTMPEPLGWVAAAKTGGLIGGFRGGVGSITFDPASAMPVIGPRSGPEPHLPGNRMNDGKADAHGAIWCGTMDMAEEQDNGTLYRLGSDGAFQVIDTGYGVPNGPAFSPCGQWLYHADSARRVIYRFALTDEGVGPREVFVRFAEEDGYPDGMICDAQGFLWQAHWDGGRISRFAPDGRLDRAIALPARRITNIAFAGEGHDRMFVTSARVGLADPGEYDGALFEVESGATGFAPGVYG
ncbi:MULTISPECIES: SMP-30/gluconolactonase/LRE family protein [unclassified Novosphingobium]|uniref:SMP-30/gluconolactonase/LRE family protein n=1 Tax=unclassified Novosphingobium TaxID=2644732 RepID=UPI001494E96B|nr:MULTISPECIES: SMP-30/gluconolactonase/LRE family protein [unclassified Novosphingobium]MBB3358687.1 sugar lactone lactonase YvrE [Novosphingobium sp. BK256]MBB3375048.1 sugar lactone lactonase YvrE [Novosphingobium sp. BK280]MBB3379264.1 sugar lactone lactonase YvrE [Novosphingobium sp. BK258]MBB3420958.1 sugar lactone lactonase YvrE [Novosphingobium sp. BK267]MBB3449469.1 sugar lactone lactonase YvrE [Novosphingobium sp. BK352]